jgi:hypothetical protein
MLHSSSQMPELHADTQQCQNNDYNNRLLFMSGHLAHPVEQEPNGLTPPHATTFSRLLRPGSRPVISIQRRSHQSVASKCR